MEGRPFDHEVDCAGGSLAPERAAWTGMMLGIRAIHVHRLDKPTTGAPPSTWAPVLDGLLPKLLRGSMQKTLQRGNDAGLRHLKPRPSSAQLARRPHRRSRRPAHCVLPTAYCFRVVGKVGHAFWPVREGPPAPPVVGHGPSGLTALWSSVHQRVTTPVAAASERMSPPFGAAA